MLRILLIALALAAGTGVLAQGAGGTVSAVKAEREKHLEERRQHAEKQRGHDKGAAHEKGEGKRGHRHE